MGKRPDLNLTRRLRKRVVASHGFRCHWCQEPLVILSDTPPQLIARRNGQWVWLRLNGTIERYRIMSMDHVQPVREGGPTTLDNLVPSCIPCNGERDWRDREAKTPEAEHVASFCRKWGRVLYGLPHPRNPHRIELDRLPEGLLQEAPTGLTLPETHLWAATHLQEWEEALLPFLPDEAFATRGPRNAWLGDTRVYGRTNGACNALRRLCLEWAEFVPLELASVSKLSLREKTHDADLCPPVREAR